MTARESFLPVITYSEWHGRRIDGVRAIPSSSIKPR